MTLIGIGVDIVDVSRFDRLLTRHGLTFVARWFSDAEISECRRVHGRAGAFAARFAVKEAVWKSVGGGDRNAPIPWRSVSVRCAAPGWAVELAEPAAGVARLAGAQSFECSVSVVGGIAIAIAHARG